MYFYGWKTYFRVQKPTSSNLVKYPIYGIASSRLYSEGFMVNEYDKCVANKMIDGKQCTIAFYVNDNKFSHMNKTIEGYFPGLVIKCGTRLNFVGMQIEFLKDKKVAIRTVQYIKRMIKEFGEDLLKKFQARQQSGFS